MGIFPARNQIQIYLNEFCGKAKFLQNKLSERDLQASFLTNKLQGFVFVYFLFYFIYYIVILFLLLILFYFKKRGKEKGGIEMSPMDVATCLYFDVDSRVLEY